MQKEKQAGEDKGIEYKVDKYTFIVTPLYNESSGKNIHQILLDLMKNDAGKPQNIL